MNADNRNGKNEFFCDLAPSSDIDTSLQYEVEWAQTSKLTRYRFLHRSGYVEYTSQEQFRSLTKLTESHLIQNGINEIGFTVRFELDYTSVLL